MQASLAFKYIHTYLHTNRFITYLCTIYITILCNTCMCATFLRRLEFRNYRPRISISPKNALLCFIIIAATTKPKTAATATTTTTIPKAIAYCSYGCARIQVPMYVCMCIKRIAAKECRRFLLIAVANQLVAIFAIYNVNCCRALCCTFQLRCTTRAGVHQLRRLVLVMQRRQPEFCAVDVRLSVYSNYGGALWPRFGGRMVKALSAAAKVKPSKMSSRQVVSLHIHTPILYI